VTPSGGRRTIETQNLVYHYLQKVLPRSDYWLNQAMLARFVVDLGVWMSPETYRVLPLLVPYAVRDPDSKGNRGRGIEYRWGQSDGAGYVRDDNSMVKDKPYGLRVEAPNPLYSGRKVEKGFKASHVWRKTIDGSHAARQPELFSFIPNLVWLPGFLADLSDREASFTQTYLQAIAVHVYRDVEIAEPLRPWAARAWSMLPEPSGIPDDGLPDVSTLNFFEHSETFVARRTAATRRIGDALSARASGQELPLTAPSAFGRSLEHLDPAVASTRGAELAAYADAAEALLEDRRSSSDAEGP
jgi:hypothetical protein